MTTPNSGSVATAPIVAGGLVVHAEALQAILGDLGTVTVAQLVALVRQYGAHAEFPTVLHAVFPEIIRPHAHAAAQITAQWFNDIIPQSDPTPVVDLAPERIAKTVDWSLYAPSDTKPVGEINPDVTLHRLAGSAKRMVFDASRDTVVTNSVKQKIKYARYASADACAFCRLLATRGPVYGSERSATMVVGRGPAQTTRGTQKLGDKYHDHCRCLVVGIPVGEEYTPPDYTAEWQKQYEAAREAGNYNINSILAHMRANTDAR